MSQPKPAAPLDDDRNLLFGVLAFRTAFIDNNEFAKVCAAWTTRKQTPLAESESRDLCPIPLGPNDPREELSCARNG
jgi:hypothetical protein